jgi:hypothetical protein
MRSLPAIAVLMTLLVPSAASAQLARPAKELVEEGIELVFRKASKEGAEELAKVGGRAAVRETLEKAAAEGGEGLVRRVTAYGLEHGPMGLRAIGRAPARMVAALDDLAPNLRGPALRAIEREPQVLLPLVERHGAKAMEAAVRHPGVGPTLGGKLGAEGLEASGHLTTDQAIVVARRADEIAALPGPQRSALMQALRGNAKGTVAFLERHPKTLLTAAGVTAFIAAKDDLLQEPTVAADGTVTGGGIVHRAWDGVFNVFRTPLGAIGTLLVVLVGGWVALRLWSTWRRLSLKHRVAASKAGV